MTKIFLEKYMCKIHVTSMELCDEVLKMFV